MVQRFAAVFFVLLSGCVVDSLVSEGRPCSPADPCGPGASCVGNRCVKTADARADHSLDDLVPADVGTDRGPDGGRDILGPDGPEIPDGAADVMQPDSTPICTAGVHPTTKECLFRPSNTKTLVYPPGGVANLSLSSNTTFDTDTGKITDGGGSVLRASGTGVVSGIGFNVVSQTPGAPMIGVFQLQSLSVPQGTTLRGVGDNALMIWAAGDVTVEGLVDVRAEEDQGGPGGGDGFIGGSRGLGGGAMGTNNNCDAGGGGGGFGAVGGMGAGEADTGCAPTPPAGGKAYGTPTLVPLHGGSAGAPGVDNGSPDSDGGGGGGALQVSAGGTFSLAAAGKIGAGGGGGEGTLQGGGGGGSGGGILIEAEVVKLSGVLTANGGGGGGGGDGTVGQGKDGEDGQATTSPAKGGEGKDNENMGDGDGGNGGALSAAATSGQKGDSGGGGGGAVGRIAIRSTSGSYSGSATISPAAVLGVIP